MNTLNYQLLGDVGEAPRPTCTVCTGPTAGRFLIVKKLPRGGMSVLCEGCALAACSSIPMMRAVELATTVEKTFPEVYRWLAGFGVWEIPLTHEDLAQAIGMPLGFPRGIWRDR